MKRSIIPIEFSVMSITPPEWREQGFDSSTTGSTAFLTTTVPPRSRVYTFRDFVTGTSLFICANNTFRLIDRNGYNSGVVRARQMIRNRHNVNIWHQDGRFSFTCHAHLTTGFCFGWLIDRNAGKSYRILDPGRTG